MTYWAIILLYLTIKRTSLLDSVSIVNSVIQSPTTNFLLCQVTLVTYANLIFAEHFYGT